MEGSAHCRLEEVGLSSRALCSVMGNLSLLLEQEGQGSVPQAWDGASGVKIRTEGVVEHLKNR